MLQCCCLCTDCWGMLLCSAHCWSLGIGDSWEEALGNRNMEERVAECKWKIVEWLLVYWGIMVFVLGSIWDTKYFENSVKKNSKIFSVDLLAIFMLWFCAAFHSWHWIYSALSSVCVCLQTNLLTATTRHFVILHYSYCTCLYNQYTIQQMHSVLHHLWHISAAACISTILSQLL